VINENILKTDINGLTADENVKVCANLPYYITTPVIMRFLNEADNIKSLTFMMQKEVADRICALPGTPDYGSITPAVRYYANAVYITGVPASCFIPKPNVDSAVIRLDVLKSVSPIDKELTFRIIKAAFEQRRKTLINALVNSAVTEISKDRLLECFSKAGISPSIRGEMLSLEEFCLLADTIVTSP
jgi:16S rRNA (adenine1518-N6/adenine1519-N6)-dimethyltransferase